MIARARAVRRFDPGRLLALVKKESLQALRDPSTLLIAFVLPVVLLFLFAYAVSLDIRKVRIGVVVESPGASAQALAAAFAATRYLDVTFAHDRREVAGQLVSGRLRGYVVIPQDFERRLAQQGREPLVQVITDGSLPNTASFVAHYAQGVVQAWRAGLAGAPSATRIELEPRYWFNAELQSKRALVPGAIAIVMTIIGTMLTALVVAREWERGTMEQLISTPVKGPELILGKLLPYFAIGLFDVLLAVLMAQFLFKVPMLGHPGLVFAIAAVFLAGALSLGMLISIVTRSQLLASQLAMVLTFLPSFILSDFMYAVSNMPAPIQAITYAVPARYFVGALKGIYMKGIGLDLLAFEAGLLTVFGAVVTLLAIVKFRKSLE